MEMVVRVNSERIRRMVEVEVVGMARSLGDAWVIEMVKYSFPLFELTLGD
jgi:hypothetical protein